MELQAEVVGKVENNMTEGQRHRLQLKLTIDGETLTFQGQQFIPALAVEEDLFNALKCGDVMTFIHNNTIHGLKLVD